MLMVHAIPMHGPSVAYDESGFPNKGGLFQESKRGGERPGAELSNPSDELTAGVL